MDIIFELKGYDGAYGITMNGEIYSKKTKGGAKELLKDWRKMKLCKNKNGYMKVNLMKGGKCESRYVHDLVASQFLGPCPPELEIMHADDNKENNNIANLSFGTHHQNMRDAGLRGRMPRGENHHLSKLTADAVLKIRLRLKTGERLRTIADDYQITCQAVHCVATGKTWGWL